MIHEPILHWNNFTVYELKEILKHYRALETLGIAQDEEIVRSIERDITLREKKISAHKVQYEKKQTMKPQKRQIFIKNDKKQQPHEYLLKQNV